MIYALKTHTVKLVLSDRKEDAFNGSAIVSAEDSSHLLKAIYSDLDPDQEHFTILALNNKLKVVGFKVLFSGGQSHSSIDLKVLFRNALLMGAAAIVLAHNHPTQDPQPSPEDNKITGTIQNAGELIGIRVIDHIIITEDTFYSYSSEGPLS